MATTVADSYERCREITRQAGSSFALGMRLFPPEDRDAVYAVYAFFRTTDDLADGEGTPTDKRAALAAWRERVLAALAGDVEPGDCLAALAETAARHSLPPAVFTECIDACLSDAGPVRLQTWDELLHYSDGVAGTVGEACLRILGYGDAETLALSRHNARAVQVTNVLRDVAEDLAGDRIYLPTDVLARHGVTLDDLAAPEQPPSLRAALSELADRTDELYRLAEPLFERLQPVHRPPIVAMTVRYRRILNRLRAQDFPRRLSSTKAEPVRVLMAALLSRWKRTWAA